MIFLCLGNEAAATFEPPEGAVVVDLGGTHRLADKALAAQWYGVAPGAWSYGLPEVHRAEGDLIANPGLVTLSRGLVAADVLASRLQGQDVRRSAFFAAVFDELGAPERSPDGAVSAIDAAIPDELIQRFA